MKKRKPCPKWKHLAWGVTFLGEYQSSLRLSYTKADAWKIGMLKSNCKTRQRAVSRGVGVCRVQVTHQQIDAEA